MKILTEEEVKAMGSQAGLKFYTPNKVLVEIVKKLQVGQAVLIDYNEWNYNLSPVSTMFNNYFKSCGVNIKVKTKKLNNGKQYLITRVN